MDDEKRGSRRIRNRVSLFYRCVGENELEDVKDEIYHTVEPEDSFSFFMSLNRLDSSFDNLNKAFVLMMKQMDAKLNYIIDLLRGGDEFDELKGFRQTYSCDISSGGISFITENSCKIGDKVFMKIFLPIATHYTIRALGEIVGESKRDSKNCYSVEFTDITNQNRELIIHYMIFVERKMAKDRLNE
ncbi:PilZ domain-containing protein [Hippea alviniae]|uniref:PilZ domain-containing protein n=1 Tax=Hippea alviniae TaxID=1279027 RepID=UPI0003B4BAC9|nr:PilZ domain-containing protein [Hippea alviniae]